MQSFVKIIDGYKEEVITDFNQLIFSGARAESPNINDNSVTTNGVDGILLDAISFAPLSLALRFGYDDIDVIDLNLFEHWFRFVSNRRHPHYAITSQIPSVKYAVNTVNVISNLKDGSSTETEASSNVYKGYSESVNWIDSEFLFDSNWVFENGIPLDFTPKYTHTSNQFTIWNDPTDAINPRFKYDLKILISLNASGGFELVNYTTGDISKYNKSIDKNTDFVLDGVHAYRDINRVGIDIDRGIITLAPGKNESKTKGDVSDIKTAFKFPPTYR